MRDITDIDQLVVDAVNEVLEALTNRNTMFTAFQVTEIVRQRIVGVNHNDVREVVNFELEEGDLANSSYTKTWTKVNGKSARVFHPDHLNVEDYDPDLAL